MSCHMSWFLSACFRTFLVFSSLCWKRWLTYCHIYHFCRLLFMPRICMTLFTCTHVQLTRLSKRRRTLPMVLPLWKKSEEPVTIVSFVYQMWQSIVNTNRDEYELAQDENVPSGTEEDWISCRECDNQTRYIEMIEQFYKEIIQHILVTKQTLDSSDREHDDVNWWKI